MGFLRQRNNGGLIRPSAGVVQIVQTAERHIRYLVPSDKPAHAISRLGLQLEHAVLSNVNVKNVFANKAHAQDTAGGTESYTISLIRHIVRMFLDLQKFHIFKTWNISQTGRVKRQTLNKTILFRHQ